METIIKIILITFFISAKAYSQWPGCSYAFLLKGTDGEFVDSTNKDYKLFIDSKTNDGPIGIEICSDNKTWRFYKGDKNLYVTNSSVIEKISEGNDTEKMIINFPPPLTGGEHKFYSNLYAGEIKFEKGTYEIKLPKTSSEWDTLKEIELCPYPNNYNEYLDVSEYQK